MSFINKPHSITTVSAIKAFKDNYIWLINQDMNGVLVDPGDAQPVFKYLKDNPLNINVILITHKHHDHMGGVKEISDRFPNIKIYAPKNSIFCFDYHGLVEGDSVEIDNMNLKFNVLETPGHTDDHIVFYNDDALFCGDTLFGCGCGRLFEGTAEEMFNSLQKIKGLRQSTKVYCAHEYTLDNIRFAMSLKKNNSLLNRRFDEDRLKSITLPSTIKVELETNPFLLARNSEEFKSIRLKKDAY